MEDRLIPVNAVLALVARDGGWFGDLAEQGFRLHALELDVQSAPGVIRADVVLYRLDPDLVLLIEGKSGLSVEERQARGYDAAEIAGIRARADLPNELVGRSVLRAAYFRHADAVEVRDRRGQRTNEVRAAGTNVQTFKVPQGSSMRRPGAVGRAW